MNSAFQHTVVPSLVGFHHPQKSKPYYHTTYNEPPKKSVIHDIGDMPTYKTIVKLKAENPQVFKDIVPIRGAFHQQMSYIYAIYKRFKGSGLADCLVTAGVVVEGSVDQALRGKHYRRGVLCIMLWREVLIHERLKKILDHEELPETIRSNLVILRNALTETQEALYKGTR